MEFKQLNVNEKMLRAIEDMGFEEMTQIQSEIIPIALEKRDVIGQSQTGTGKTVAFGIPMIENIDFESERIQSIVLTPTRELAVQVTEELNRLLKYYPSKAVAVYGGEEINKQIKRLKKHPNIVVATPGRLMDHMRRRTVKTEFINTVVLDEADEMLSMGFIEDIETILADMPNRQITMLFSATMPDRIKKISSTFMNEPAHVKVKSKAMTVDLIDQKYIELKEKDKFEALCHLIDIYQPPLCIIFGRTKRRVDELISGLSSRDYKVEGLHGDMRQEKREKVLEKFKKRQINILVATDIAARGLDISGVTHVINFDLPQEIESYVHRIGRTGRAGNTGVSFTFVHPKEMEFLQEIERHTKSKMERFERPSGKQAMNAKYMRASDKIVEKIEDERDKELEKIANALLEKYDAADLLASALKIMTKSDKKPSDVKLTFESPLKLSKKYRKNDKNNSRGRNRNSQRYNKSGKKNFSDKKNFSGKRNNRKRSKKSSDK